MPGAIFKIDCKKAGTVATVFYDTCRFEHVVSSVARVLWSNEVANVLKMSPSFTLYMPFSPCICLILRCHCRQFAAALM